MEITEKILNALKKAIHEEEKQLDIDVELVKKHDIECLMELSYIEGKRDMLMFLMYVLEDNPEEIAVLNKCLKEN